MNSAGTDWWFEHRKAHAATVADLVRALLAAEGAEVTWLIANAEDRFPVVRVVVAGHEWRMWVRDAGESYPVWCDGEPVTLLSARFDQASADLVADLLIEQIRARRASLDLGPSSTRSGPHLWTFRFGLRRRRRPGQG